jgi:hypothetical protein
VKTKTIQQTVRFKASPREVYEFLMDSKKQQALSGEKAIISTKVPGKLAAWNGHITGFNLKLKPGTKIVQAWPPRVGGRIITRLLSSTPRRPRMVGCCATQIGIPPHRYSGHYRGWIEA